jgi:hypothetical protein
MSTKIYNGVKLKSKDWKEVMEQLLSIKKEAEKISMQSISYENLSLFIIANKISDKDEYYIFDEIEKSLAFPDKYIFKIPFNFSICLYPTKEGDIYGAYFDSLKGHYELIEPFIYDFHYQNSTDKPEDISDEDWNFRRNKWDELVDYRFNEKAFIFNIVDYNSLNIMDVTDKIKKILPLIRRQDKIDQVIETK